MRTAAQDNALAKYARDETRPGICRDIAQAVTTLDPSLTFNGLDSRMPITRIEKSLESGTIDVFFCFLKTRERLKKFRYIDVPLYSIRHVLLARDHDAIDIRNYDELRALGDNGIVLVNFGSALVQVLDEAGVKNISSAKNDMQLIRMLDSGRGRFIYGQDLTLIEMLRRLNLSSRYRFLPVTLKVENQYLSYSKNLNPATVAKLEKALRTLQQQGRLHDIAKRYH